MFTVLRCDEVKQIGNCNLLGKAWDFVMGLNNTFKYKNFDLRVFMYWRQGQMILFRLRAGNRRYWVCMDAGSCRRSRHTFMRARIYWSWKSTINRAEITNKAKIHCTPISNEFKPLKTEHWPPIGNIKAPSLSNWEMGQTIYAAISGISPTKL